MGFYSCKSLFCVWTDHKLNLHKNTHSRAIKLGKGLYSALKSLALFYRFITSKVSLDD